MNVVCLGDLHLASKNNVRKDCYYETLFKKLDFVYWVANKFEACVIQTGDILHSNQIPDWVIHKFIEKTCKNLHREFYFIVGNHDHDSDNWENEKIGYLPYIDKIQHLNDRHAPSDIVILGCNHWDNVPLKKDVDLLVTHHDFNVTEKTVIVDGQPKPIISRYPKAACRVWLNGHIHYGHSPTQIGNTLYINPGSLMRMDRSQEILDHQPQIALLQLAKDSVKCNTLIVPHLPASEIFHDKPEEMADKEWFVDFVSRLGNTRAKDGQLSVVERVKAMVKSGMLDIKIAQIILEELRNIPND